MNALPAGTIDCDLHPAIPGIAALLPYMDAYWREHIQLRGLDGLDLASYSPRNPLSGRPDWRPDNGKPGCSLEMLRRQALDAFGSRLAICNVLYGGPAVFNPDMGAALCRASNAWLAHEWLDREPRLRGVIAVPLQDPKLAVEEIKHWAPDPRFVQVMLLSMTEMPLGRRHYWPIYAAAEQYGLPVGIHAGNTNRHAATYNGWSSFFIEDYAAQSQAFQAQLLSLVYEGVFNKFPKLRVVLIESGVSWLPNFLWRAVRIWRSLRVEVPWVTRSPAEIIREHVRLTTQPFDIAPTPQAGQLDTLMRQFGSDEMLLFATDYPHWHFEDDAVLPAGLSAELLQKICVDNALQTYPRLHETVAAL